MEVFKRSWEITKLSFGVINKDRELLLFPLVGGIFSLLFMFVMLFPTVITAIGGTLFYVSLFIVYFGLAFIATFFNVCVVYSTKIRFEGGNATFMESIKFSLSKIHLIFLWSVVSATVGIILRILYDAADRLGPVGEMIARIILSIVGAAWSIVTIFVIPGLVFYDLGPFTAIKKSAQTLRHTWGESLIRHFGLGIMQAICVVLSILIGGILLVLAIISGSVIAIVIAGLILAALILGTILVFQVANHVFNTALFIYADQGKLPEGFNEELVRNSFVQKVRK